MNLPDTVHLLIHVYHITVHLHYLLYKMVKMWKGKKVSKNLITDGIPLVTLASYISS